MAEEKAMPPRSSFSICLSIFSFSREGSKATLVLVCPIFFFRISLFEASSQGNPETSTDSPSPVSYTHLTLPTICSV